MAPIGLHDPLSKELGFIKFELSMDIRELQLFRHLATTLHFGRTSQACNITPSALTRAIQRLEERVGKELFRRDNRSVQLTPAGRRFLRYAEECVGQWQLLQDDLAAEAKVLQGELRIYCSVTAVYGILPRILGSFRKTHPQVHLHLQTGDAASALAKLQNSEVDAAIAALPEKLPPRLFFHQVMETPLLFIAAGPFTGLGKAPAKIDWERTPVILAEKGVERRRLDAWFRERGIAPNIYAQVAGNEAIIAMVSLGCGIGLIPALVLERSPLRDEVSVLDVTPPLAPLAVGIAIPARSNLSPIVEAFRQTAEELSRKDADPDSRPPSPATS